MAYKYVVVFSNKNLKQRRKIIEANNQAEADKKAKMLDYPKGYAIDYVQKLRC